MKKHESRNIKFGNIKGNVVISNDQQGGTTTHHQTIPLKASKSKLEIFAFWIILIAGIVAILTYFGIYYNPKTQNSVKILDTNKKSVTDTNDHSHKNISPHFKRKPVYTNKKNNEKPDAKIQIGAVSGDVVISTNQTGGITAHTVIVPEDKEIPLKDNILMEETKYGGQTAVKFSPKHGTWENPFIAFPVGEKVSNGIIITTSSTTYSDVKIDSIISCNMEGETDVKFELTKWGVPKITVQAPIFMIYKKLPSKIFVGDWSNKEKRYTYSTKHD